MTDYTYSLERVLGQRPFAYVPRSIARAGKHLSHGAVALYATLSALSDDEGSSYGSAHTLGLFLNASPRSVRRWIAELQQLPPEVFETYRDRPGSTNTFYIQPRGDITAPGASGFAYVRLIDWHAPWTGLERRLWIVLWSYCGRKHGCYVGMTRLANDCGADPRNVRKARGSLEAQGLVEVIRRQRQSSDTLLFTGERWLTPAPRGKRARPARPKGRTLSPDQARTGGRVGHTHPQPRTRSPATPDTLAPYLGHARPQGRTRSPPDHKSYHETEHETEHETQHIGASADADRAMPVARQPRKEPRPIRTGEALEAERKRQLAELRQLADRQPQPEPTT